MHILPCAVIEGDRKSPGVELCLSDTFCKGSHNEALSRYKVHSSSRNEGCREAPQGLSATVKRQSKH